MGSASQSVCSVGPATRPLIQTDCNQATDLLARVCLVNVRNGWWLMAVSVCGSTLGLCVRESI